MKRSLSIIILVVMTLHSLSRLGVLSYVYGQRHDIAFQLGISTEKVIATCSSEFFASKDLSIQDKQSNDIPLSIAQAQEITLFVPGEFTLPLSGHSSTSNKGCSPYLLQKYFSPYTDIFRPPCLQG